MLANAEIVTAVAETLTRLRLPHLVVDPVMIAKGGDRLLEEAAVAAIRELLLPLAEVVTPNIPEAEVLSGMKITSLEDMREAGQRILALGPRVVLVKGGHLESADSIDVACTAAGTEEFRSPRISSVHTHGTGCTLASAIAANLATGLDHREAIACAKAYVVGAIRNAPGIGRGQGPLNHFWRATEEPQRKHGKG
jgi:hydroxymethylpyrimidine/phosphomethylpyrimidine kinase